VGLGSFDSCRIELPWPPCSPGPAMTPRIKPGTIVAANANQYPWETWGLVDNFDPLGGGVANRASMNSRSRRSGRRRQRTPLTAASPYSRRGSPTSTPPRTSIPVFAGVFLLHQDPLGAGGRREIGARRRSEGMTATPHCDKTAFSRLANRMSLAPQRSYNHRGPPVHTAIRSIRQWSMSNGQF